MDCFSNKLAPCAQTVFSKQSLCSPDSYSEWFAVLTKICQRSAETSGQTCTLISEGDGFVQIGCSTLSAAPFVERCTRQKKRAYKYTSNLYRLQKCRSFPHDRYSSERDTTAQAFGEIFADFSSIAIARDALFEHCVRVYFNSNP